MRKTFSGKREFGSKLDCMCLWLEDEKVEEKLIKIKEETNASFCDAFSALQEMEGNIGDAVTYIIYGETEENRSYRSLLIKSYIWDKLDYIMETSSCSLGKAFRYLAEFQEDELAASEAIRSEGNLPDEKTKKIDTGNYRLEKIISRLDDGVEEAIKEIKKGTNASSYEAYEAFQDMGRDVEAAVKYLIHGGEKNIEKDPYHLLFQAHIWEKMEYIMDKTSCRLSKAFKNLIECNEDEMAAIDAIGESE